MTTLKKGLSSPTPSKDFERVQKRLRLKLRRRISLYGYRSDYERHLGYHPGSGAAEDRR